MNDRANVFRELSATSDRSRESKDGVVSPTEPGATSEGLWHSSSSASSPSELSGTSGYLQKLPVIASGPSELDPATEMIWHSAGPSRLEPSEVHVFVGTTNKNEKESHSSYALAFRVGTLL